MFRVLHTEPEFAEMFMAHLLARNSRVEADLVDQLFNSSEKRLARDIFYLCAMTARNANLNRSRPRLRRRLSADMIGTTRSRVSVFMNKFRKLGLIDYNGELKVNSALLNVVLHE